MSSNMMMSGRSAVANVSIVSAYGSGSPPPGQVDITMPSNEGVNDLLIFTSYALTTLPVWGVLSTGFTLRYDQGATVGLCVASKIDNGAEPSPAIFDATTPDTHFSSMIRLRNAVWDQVGVAASVTANGVLAIPSITLTTPCRVFAVVCLNGGGGDTCSTPAGWTVLETNNFGQAIYYKDFSAGATGAVNSNITFAPGTKASGVLFAVRN